MLILSMTWILTMVTSQHVGGKSKNLICHYFIFLIFHDVKLQPVVNNSQSLLRVYSIVCGSEFAETLLMYFSQNLFLASVGQGWLLFPLLYFPSSVSRRSNSVRRSLHLLCLCFADVNWRVLCSTLTSFDFRRRYTYIQLPEALQRRPELQSSLTMFPAQEEQPWRLYSLTSCRLRPLNVSGDYPQISLILPRCWVVFVDVMASAVWTRTHNMKWSPHILSNSANLLVLGKNSLLPAWINPLYGAKNNCEGRGLGSLNYMYIIKSNII